MLKSETKKMLLDPIRSLVQDELSATDGFIINSLQSNITMVKDIIEYVMSCGGKRVRPLLLLLSAKAHVINDDNPVQLAAAIELIHTATLLHDDVVDDSTLRRGHKTANLVWGNDASVLVGDYLYSRAFQIVVDIKHRGVLEVFSQATPYIAEGEILQLVNCHNPDTSDVFYYDIIQRKTAKLFEIAAQLGAMVCTDNTMEIDAMREFGLQLGLAYQLIDDALDYSQSTEQTGKNVGQDIAEGKTTLPLIHAMRHSKGKQLEKLRHAIETGSSEHIDDILGMIESTEAIQYTTAIANSHVSKAKEALAPIPKNSYRDALSNLADFVVQRSY